MEALKVEEFKRSIGTKTMKIDGFTGEELYDFERMDYRDMKNQVLEELDKRNNGIGTCWHNGYGVYNMWTRDNSVYVEIGTSCD